MDAYFKDNGVGEILFRYGQLLAVQQIWLPEWQEVADYVIPRKNSIAVQRIPGYKRTQRLFDSTAPHDMELLAAAIHGTLTPSFMRWFRIKIGDTEQNQIFENRVWLDIVNDKMRNELNKSNFNSEVHECYTDLTSFGTGCLYEDEKDEGWWGGLNFSCTSISKYCVAENQYGQVDTLYREIPMSTHGIMDKWPDTIPDAIKDCKKPDELWSVVHAVVPNSGGRRKQEWESTYILFKTRDILSQKGYYDFPFMVPRWNKYSDETYGRCPTYTALPDIRTLNKLVEMELRNLAKNVDPPLGAVMGEVTGPARMIPGGITTVSRRESLFPIDTGGNFQVTNLKKEELKQSIHSIYMIDQLQMAQNGPQMTATEVNVRYETMQRILGPTLGRMDREFATPLIRRTFNLMLRAGLFSPLPQALTQGSKGKPIPLIIEYEGPLARAMKSSDVQSIQSLDEMLEPITKFDQDVVDVIDFDELTRSGAEALGIPAVVIRDKQQVQQMRAQKQQVAEQQNQMDQAEQGSNIAKNAAPMVRSMSERAKAGSPLSKMG